MGNMYGKKDNNECYTPKYGVIPILKYIPKDAVIWCPFDKKESEFVIEISKTNKVIYSHIDNKQDFFTYTPNEHWDIIISNPPFTNKRQFFERALSFNKPFALLMTMAWLNDAAPKQLFKEKQLQLMMFDKRIKYMNNNVVQDKITFSSGYYCYDFLPSQIVMEEL